MAITRLRITNYRGVEALDMPIPDRGMMIKGKNGQGKTSVLNAIRAALDGNDVAADAIRFDADKAEILVELDHRYDVKRTITAKTSTLSVETGEGKHRAKLGQPQTWLREMLGTAAVDPVEIYLAKPKERREIVLGALPVKMKPEHLKAWIPSQAHRDLLAAAIAPKTVDALFAGHGLEACATVHKVFYDVRKNANADLKKAKTDAEAARTRLAASPMPDEAAPTVDAAELLVKSSRAAIDELTARGERARKQEAASVEARTKVAELRSEATAHREAAAKMRDEGGDRAALRAAGEETYERVEAAQRALDEAKEAHAKAMRALEDSDRVIAKAFEREKAAAGADEAATSFEKMISAGIEAAPTPAEIAEATGAYTHAEKSLDLAKQFRARVELAAEVKKLDDAQRAAEENAGTLTAIVEKLAKDGPAQLLRESDGIPGLGVDGDALTLDGVVIDKLSGREQMKLAIEIARRANVKAKILIVDGLERVGPEEMPEFVKEATRDGWQLIGTKVDRGDVVIEAFSVDDAHAHANGEARAS